MVERGRKIILNADTYFYKVIVTYQKKHPVSLRFAPLCSFALVS